MTTSKCKRQHIDRAWQANRIFLGLTCVRREQRSRICLRLKVQDLFSIPLCVKVQGFMLLGLGFGPRRALNWYLGSGVGDWPSFPEG